MKIYILLVFIFVSFTNAFACKDQDKWSNSRYINNNNGTITDTKTNLMWKTCSNGQLWSNTPNYCTGDATSTNWEEANKVAAVENNNSKYKNWRLPKIKDLISLSAYNISNPSINISMFPNTSPNNYFWSSSPSANDTTKSWYLVFNYGDNKKKYYRNGAGVLRLVRNIK